MPQTIDIQRLGFFTEFCLDGLILCSKFKYPCEWYLPQSANSCYWSNCRFIRSIYWYIKYIFMPILPLKSDLIFL